jgi:hypothetical protein
MEKQSTNPRKSKPIVKKGVRLLKLEHSVAKQFLQRLRRVLSVMQRVSTLDGDDKRTVEKDLREMAGSLEHSTATDLEAIDLIVGWFERNASHVLNIAAGPTKREAWFNAESIVALSHGGGIHKFLVYGEQQYESALRSCGLTEAEILDPKCVPDIVGYVHSGADNQRKDEFEVNFIMEAKVLYRAKPESDRKTQLVELRDQLMRAKRHGQSAIGLVYLISHSGDRPSKASRDKNTKTEKSLKQIVMGDANIMSLLTDEFHKSIKTEVHNVFKETTYIWLREPAALNGMQFGKTSFPESPSMDVSVGLAALRLS